MDATESAFCKGFLLVALLAPTVGCAGSRKTVPTTNSSGSVTVRLTPSSLTLNPGAQQQFTVTVSGSENTAVSWSVDSVNAGDSAVGTITATGLYTAPSSSGTHTIAVTSAADATRSASATVTVQGLVSLSPATAGLTLGATQQFTVTVQGQTNPIVTWSVDGVNGGNSSLRNYRHAGTLLGTFADRHAHRNRERSRHIHRIDSLDNSLQSRRLPGLHSRGSRRHATIHRQSPGSVEYKRHLGCRRYCGWQQFRRND